MFALYLARSLPMGLKKSSPIFNYFLPDFRGWFHWIFGRFAAVTSGMHGHFLLFNATVFSQAVNT